MRKYYIDNLRNITILLLFPVHTFMIWNDFGSGFYIWQRESRVLSTLIVMINPWFMPLLFVLAGMSARYALEKRTYREFILNRTRKLLMPFVCGTVFLNPFMTFFARKHFYNYEGSLLDNWKYFFTHITDLSGYDGSFTPGHLWFILFLYIIAVVSLLIFLFIPCLSDMLLMHTVRHRMCLPFGRTRTGEDIISDDIISCEQETKRLKSRYLACNLYKRVVRCIRDIPARGIFFLFIPVWFMYYIGNFGGYSIGKNMALYLIGYYILAGDSAMNKLERNIKWMSVLCAAGNIALAVLYYRYAYYGDLWINYIGWNTILVLLAAGKRFLNRYTGFTGYFNRASYPIYILHQPILVAVSYYVVRLCDSASYDSMRFRDMVQYDTARVHNTLPYHTVPSGNAMPLCGNVALQAILICFGSFALTVLAYHIIRYAGKKLKLPKLF